MQTVLTGKLVPMWLIFLMLLSGFANPSFGQCEKQKIPPGIGQYLSRQFPDWELVAVKNLLEYHQELWLQEHSGDCPGLARGWFEPSRRWKTAVLIVPKLESENRAKVLLIKQVGTKYSSIVLADIKERGAVPVIFSAPAGEYKSSDSTRKVKAKAKYAVISLVFYESSATVFYWSNGKFRELQVSD